MGRYRILIKRSAAKELEAISTKKLRQQIVRKIDALSDTPRPRDCQKLSGQDRYRLRQGDYRIVYEIRDRELVVFLVKVGHRREVYRNP